MDMSWLVHTLGNASMMAPGMERLLNVVHQGEVSMMPLFNLSRFTMTPLNLQTVSCKKLVAPKYGQVWVTGNSYSSTAYYRCNYGYDLHGSHSRKCQHDGTWYGKAPECRIAKRSKCFFVLQLKKKAIDHTFLFLQLAVVNLIPRDMAKWS